MSLDIYDGQTIVVGDEGPPGIPAAQDIGLSFSQGYHASEILNGVVATHAVMVSQANCAFKSRTAPTGVVTFPIYQNTVQIGHATMDPASCGPGPVFVGSVVLTTDPTLVSDGDLIDWSAPVAVDATFTRGELTLGSK